MAASVKNPNKSEAELKFEELRVKAREYENELDSMIFQFSKFQANRNETRISIQKETNHPDGEPLIDDQDRFENKIGEMEQLLTMLQDINNQMADACQQISRSNSVLYILQRHQEILKDYRNEFYKSRDKYQEKLNRAKLFQGHQDNNDYGYLAHKKTDYLTKESESLTSSESMIDDQIFVAMRTREALRNQRSLMKTIQTQLTTLENKFPVINNVLQKIGMKKKKNAIILAIVIAVCIILFFLL